MPARCVVSRVRCPWQIGSCSPVCPLGVLCCVCGVLGSLVPVHRCDRSLCYACGVVGHLAPVHRCARLVCCVWSITGNLAPVHRCAGSVCSVVCAVSLATWLLFTDVPAHCVLWRVRCPWPLGSCSPVCQRSVLGARCPWSLGSCSPVCPRGVLCAQCPWPLGSVHRRCAVCAVSSATWLLFIGVPAWCVMLHVRCCWQLGSCSPVCMLGVLCVWCLCPARGLCWVFGVLRHLALVHWCALLVCIVVCAVSLATWPLFNGVSARGVVLYVRCPWQLGSRSPVCPLGVFVVCALSLAT